MGWLQTRAAIALTSAALALCACTSLVGSEKLMLTEGPVRCNSSFGSYAMPKLMMKATVTENSANQYLDLVETYVADNSHTFCLDYLASPASHDKVSISMSKSGSLISVTSSVVEQSALIIRTLIRTAFLSISRNPGGKFRTPDGAASPSREIFSYTFDPFDRAETDFVNSELSKFGFCVFVSDYTFDSTSLRGQDYCDNPNGPLAQAAGSLASYVKEKSQARKVVTEAIFYRPSMTYRMEAWRKPDPQGPDDWQLAQDKSFNAPNLSPVLAVGVRRSLFAKRNTKLTFAANTGDLKEFCVHKSSEALEAIQIPLDIVYGLVELPSQTLMAQIKDVSGTKDLLEAQQQVVDAQKQLIQLQQYSISSTGNGSVQGVALPTTDKFIRETVSLGIPALPKDEMCK